MTVNQYEKKTIKIWPFYIIKKILVYKRKYCIVHFFYFEKEWKNCIEKLSTNLNFLYGEMLYLNMKF